MGGRLQRQEAGTVAGSERRSQVGAGGKQAGAVQAERSRLEEELAQVQRQLQQAQEANSAVSEGGGETAGEGASS